MYILLVISILFAVVGVSLAFFSLNIIGNDKAKDLTRILDYYKNIGVTMSKHSEVIKKNENIASNWWLRWSNSNLLA